MITSYRWFWRFEQLNQVCYIRSRNFWKHEKIWKVGRVGKESSAPSSVHDIISTRLLRLPRVKSTTSLFLSFPKADETLKKSLKSTVYQKHISTDMDYIRSFMSFWCNRANKRQAVTEASSFFRATLSPECAEVAYDILPSSDFPLSI